jgi:hypothetical protein
MKKNYSPDAVPAAGTTAAPVKETAVNHHATMPVKHADLLNVSQQVVTQWTATPAITLVWKTVSDFAVDVKNFQNEFQQRNTSGGFISQNANALENLDHEADDALPFVKAYINDLFGPANGKSHFAEFGMVHSKTHGYEFPYDRQKRLDAIRMMSEAITNNSLDAKTYGQPFWSNLLADYTTAMGTSQSGTGEVSAHVGNLSQLRRSLRRTLHSLLLVLEGNYPDTFHDVIRTWGFTKENY